jgi:hypothetical protein
MTIARRTKTYAAAALSDLDGILASFATTTDETSFDAGDFDGAAISADTGVLDLPRTVTITLDNSAGAFSTPPFVGTAPRAGTVVTESFTPNSANGNETLFGNQPFDTLTSIVFPAQADTDGAFTVGVGDICAPAGGTFCGVELAATGTLHVQYGESSGVTDAIVVPAALVGYVKQIAPTRILTGTGETTVGVTVYLP